MASHFLARPLTTAALMTALSLTLAACGGTGSGLFGSRGNNGILTQEQLDQRARADATREAIDTQWGKKEEGSKIWDLFNNQADPNTTVEVNKYLWRASLEVLNFLPIQSVDPFTGVLVTGYGTPPGGGRSYRATVYVQDTALDARSLKVSLQGSGGSAVSPETVRAVEDAILTRARQLRVRDSKL